MRLPKYKIDDVLKVKDCDHSFAVYSIGITKSLGAVYYPMGENGYLEDELEPVEIQKVSQKIITREWNLRLALLGAWIAFFLALFLSK